MADENTPLVLVTGSSGYVAAHCVKQLLEEGNYKVRGTVRSLKNEEVCEALKALVPDAKFPLELVEADLLDEESWKKAVEGCSYVLHLASPFLLETPKNVDELLKPAIDGTLNVLKACKEVGGIKRVVLTSSVAAIWVGNLGKVLDEESWSDLKKATPYEYSKTAAEKAAWDFVAELPEESKFELATINPGLIVGPLLQKKKCASFDVIRQLLERDSSVVPDICMLLVDVRDVAKAHILAMTKPEAAGKRHILSAAENSYSFLDIARFLANEFNSKGYNVPMRKAPKFVLWMLSWFNKDVRSIYPYIGSPFKANTSRLRDVLGIEPRKIEESIVEMGHSVIDLGMIKKPQAQKQRSNSKKAPPAEAAKPDTEQVKEGENQKESENQKENENQKESEESNKAEGKGEEQRGENEKDDSPPTDDKAEGD